MEPLVSTAWVAEHLSDHDLRILDATVNVDVTTGAVESGRARREAGHVPGATFADLLVELSDPNAVLPFAMPSAERFAAAMERLGVGDGSRVVVYDARESMWAARVWWMLTRFGFDDAAVLDGGWTAWVQEGRPVSTSPPDVRTASFTPRPRPGLLVGKEHVLAALTKTIRASSTALQPPRVHGRTGLLRAGGSHPRRRERSARRIINRDTQRYVPQSRLREMFERVLTAERAITYCGGGVAAASDAFALHLLGFEHVAVYDGSMMEWSADPKLPLVKSDT